MGTIRCKIKNYDGKLMDISEIYLYSSDGYDERKSYNGFLEFIYFKDGYIDGEKYIIEFEEV